MKRLLALSLSLAAILVARSAAAAVDTGTVTVTASVARACTIGDTTLAFGTYDPFGVNIATPLDATATITLTCTGATPWTVGIDNGVSGTRTMVDPLVPGSALPYEIYRDAGHAQVWGSALVDRASGTQVAQGSTNLTLYGRIANGLTPLAGLGYTQTLTATIEF